MLFFTTTFTVDFVIVLPSARKVNILEIRISVMTEKYPSGKFNEFPKDDTMLTVPGEFTMYVMSHTKQRNGKSI